MGTWMTIHQKRGLIHMAADCPTMSQAALAAWAKAHYKLKRAPAQTTVSDILKKAALIMSKDYSNENLRKPLKVTSAALEARLWSWIQAVEAQNVCLSLELIRMKAIDIQRELCDAWDLGFSDGWLSAFEHRHRLRYRNRPGESDPAAVARMATQSGSGHASGRASYLAAAR